MSLQNTWSCGHHENKRQDSGHRNQRAWESFGFIGALSSRYMGGILTEKKVCKFCGDRLINTGSEGSEKRSCPRCKAIIWNDQGRQPRCPQCNEKAWRVIITDDLKAMQFVHNIKDENGNIVYYGHNVSLEEL